MSHELNYSEKAIDNIKSITKGDKPSAKLLKEKIKSLEDDPFPHGIKKVSEDIYRIRCGNYRVIYSVENKKIYILCIKRRNENTYSDLKHFNKIIDDIKKINSED